MNLIRKAWCAKTSADPDHWSPMNPAWGQCAVTALVVQDLLGGVIVCSEYDTPHHYWNLLDDGTEIDLTLEQFKPELHPVIKRVSFKRDHRDHVVAYPDTVVRYHLLRERVGLATSDSQPTPANVPIGPVSAASPTSPTSP